MNMQAWLQETDNFLNNNRRRVLKGKGQVSYDEAMKKAADVYEKFRIQQDGDYISIFDNAMSEYLKGKADKPD